MNEITITPGCATPAGRVTLTAKLDETIIDVRQVNLAKPKERDQYLDDLVAKVQTLDRADLERELLVIASEVAAQSAESSAEERTSQATLIINLVKESDAELFHDEEGTGFATISIGDHRETHRVNSRSFRRWLGRLHFDATQSAANSQSISDAITTLEGMALYDGPECVTYIRIAPHGDSIVIDLGDREWNTVVVNSEGWGICDSRETPVRFRRAAGMRPLPMPVRGGSLNELRSFLNIGGDAQWALLLGCMIGAFRPRGPYPVLAVHGQHGTAKSSLCRFVRALIDPNTTPLRRPPKEERDLMIAAGNSWVVAYDNLSGLPVSLSDGLCVLATGGGFATRELFTDADERLFSAMRPTLVNGIDDLATRSDLLDRCINLKLPVITDDQRRDEAELNAAFERAAPRILGALLDAVSMALRNLATVRLERKPRMADFAIWVVAAEPALGLPPGVFLNAYLENRSEASVLAVESATIGPAIQSMMADRSTWEGTAKELLNLLNDDKYSDEQTRKAKEWPKGPRGLRSALDRLAPNLRAIGIEVGLPKDRIGHANKRLISIKQGPAQQVAQGAPVAKPPYDPNTDGWPPDECDPLPTGAASRQVAAAVDRSQSAPLCDSKTQIATCATDATHLAGPSSEFDDDYAAAMKALNEEELQ